MNYFKSLSGQVYAYDEDQVLMGLASDKIAMTQAEIAAHKHPQKTEEQLRDEWKVARAEAVKAITVTTSVGNTFDGDEESQGRMARAILGLQAAGEGTTVNWVLADNAIIAATAGQLAEALALAGAEQARLWLPSASDVDTPEDAPK